MQSTHVSWPLGPTTVHGTLVRPDGPGPFPGVVLVAGSGPTDRDWNSPLLAGSNGSAHLLAEALARAGIASLRYDKRASGPHVRETIPLLIGKMTMPSYADELAGAVRTLAEADGIRDDRLFGLGNSEGTLHVLHYQLGDPAIPFAGWRLTGPPGAPSARLPGRSSPRRPPRSPTVRRCSPSTTSSSRASSRASPSLPIPPFPTG